VTHPAAEPRGLHAALVELLGEAAVVSGDASRPYLQDQTSFQGLKGRADAVVLPGSADDVAALVAWCYDEGLPIVPRGGGTGLAGGAVPTEGGVVCSVERLNRVLGFDPELWRMHVEAGVTTARVRALARGSGLLFPPDPGAGEQSQIGGNIACNAGGPHSFKYGVTGAWVTGIEAVIGGGRRLVAGGPLRKDVAGYDLKSLLVGSEGTLGIVTSAWLRLIPAPEARRTIVAAYADSGSGMAAILAVLGSGINPATLEYFDAGCVAATRAAFPGGLPNQTGFLIVTEVDGPAAALDGAQAQVLEALSPSVLTTRVHASRGEHDELERWRTGVSFAVSAQHGGKMSEDIAVPVDRLGEAIAMTVAAAARVGLQGCSWGHAGDGNLHATFLIDASNPAEVAAAERGMEAVFAGALGLGGTVSGEHGLGWVKRGQFARQFAGMEADLQAQIKAIFDPLALLNPGKKVPFPVQAGGAA
jgi:glycolate oxidase subunit GlcD